jgi:hypothetical protein
MAIIRLQRETLLLLILLVLSQALPACFAAVAGASTGSSVGLRIAAGAIPDYRSGNVGFRLVLSVGQ